MNEQEYMEQLRKLICEEPDEFQNDILETFRLHFEEGHSEGRTDQQIIKELGSPEEVYESICGLYEEADQSEKKTEKGRRNLFGSLLTIVKEQAFQRREPEEGEYQEIHGENISRLSIQSSSSDIIARDGSEFRYA